jgi:hypothetical protein
MRSRSIIIRPALAAAIVLVFAACGVLGATQATQPAPQKPADTRRAVEVTNVVPAGASPIHGAVVKVEVIEAVDIRSGNSWRTKIAVRIRNARGDRVRCSLRLYYDGKPFDAPGTVDLLQGGVDLDIYAEYGGDGKRAGQLSKLTAEASGIRIGG